MYARGQIGGFLIEKTESHVVIFFLFLLDGGSSRLSSSRCSGGKCARISEESLDHLSLLEGDVGDGGNGEKVLHTVDNGVRDRGGCGVSNLKGDGGHISDSIHEDCLQVIVSNVQDGRIEHGSRIVHLLNDQSIGEGRDLQHIQEGSLGHTDLFASSDQMHVRNNFNCTLGNL